MTQNQILILFIIIFGAVLIIMALINRRSLDNIKSRPTGNGQHGTARWATIAEINRTYKSIPYSVSDWRHKVNRPVDVQGTILGYRKVFGKMTTLVDTGDNHTLMIAAAGAGKTACFIYPNLEFCCASGMSFAVTDTKGDIYRNFGTIAKTYYGYDVSVIDLRNPTRSNGFNMLKLVNEYMDKYTKTKALCDKSKAEKYAKIIAKTIIHANGAIDYGQNSFFYDAAEGLITSAVLLVSEFCEPNKRHILSAFTS